MDQAPEVPRRKVELPLEARVTSALSSVSAPTMFRSPLLAISTLPASAALPSRDSVTFDSVPPVALSCDPSIS